MSFLFLDDIFELKTPADSSIYVVDLPFLKSYFPFSVRACSDALIELDAIIGNRAAKSYLLEIGSNSNTEIKLFKYDGNGNAQQIKQQNQLNVLHCDSFRPLWVAFEGGKIELGQGHSPYVNSIFSHTDDSPLAVQGISFLTTANGGVGFWQFQRSFGNFLLSTIQ